MTPDPRVTRYGKAPAPRVVDTMWSGPTLFAPDQLPAPAPRILSLVQRFGVPPFSVFDARAGYWQERKAAWIGLGIQSELGRGATAYNMAKDANATGELDDAGRNTGTSIFDPVLTECAIRWFSPPTGRVLDPFAGGSVRGVVSGILGRTYYGVDLSQEQVDANDAQLNAIGQWCQVMPIWMQGDSRSVLAGLDPLNADMMLTCPPYYDLEVYSDDPTDLSAMATYDEFLAAYRDILWQGVRHLADDTFAVVVVGNLRDRRGCLRDLVGDTIRAMTDAGAAYYNEAILITQVGTAAIRAFQFSIGRKLVRTHQTALVFVKGDPRRAADRCGALTADDAGVTDVAGPAPLQDEPDIPDE